MDLRRLLRVELVCVRRGERGHNIRRWNSEEQAVIVRRGEFLSAFVCTRDAETGVEATARKLRGACAWQRCFCR